MRIGCIHSVISPYFDMAQNGVKIVQNTQLSHLMYSHSSPEMIDRIDTKRKNDTIPNMKNNTPILDACCGSKMFWFNRNNVNVTFVDKRKIDNQIIYASQDGKDVRFLTVNPDVVADFRNLPFENESFWHVVFDPPHLRYCGEKSYMRAKYGSLDDGWEDMIHKGFEECWRVLKTNGTLIFKWNETQIKIKDVLKAIGREPLYGHLTGKGYKTMWAAFVKLPEVVE